MSDETVSRLRSTQLRALRYNQLQGLLEPLGAELHLSLSRSARACLDPREYLVPYSERQPYRPVPLAVVKALSPASLHVVERSIVDRLIQKWMRRVKPLLTVAREGATSAPRRYSAFRKAVKEYLGWLGRHADSELPTPDECGLHIAAVRYAACRLEHDIVDPSVFVRMLRSNPALLHPWRRFAEWLESTHSVIVPCDWSTPPADNLGIGIPVQTPRYPAPMEVVRVAELTTLVVLPIGAAPRASPGSSPLGRLPVSVALRQEAARTSSLREDVARCADSESAVELYAKVLTEVGQLSDSTIARYVKRVRYVLRHAPRFPKAIPASVLVDSMLATVPTQRQCLRAAWNAFVAMCRWAGQTSPSAYASLRGSRLAGFDLSRPWPNRVCADIGLLVEAYGAAAVHRATWRDVAVSPRGNWEIRCGSNPAYQASRLERSSSAALKRLARWSTGKTSALPPTGSQPVAAMRPRGNVAASAALLKALPQATERPR